MKATEVTLRWRKIKGGLDGKRMRCVIDWTDSSFPTGKEPEKKGIPEDRQCYCHKVSTTLLYVIEKKNNFQGWNFPVLALCRRWQFIGPSSPPRPSQLSSLSKLFFSPSVNLFPVPLVSFLISATKIIIILPCLHSRNYVNQENGFWAWPAILKKLLPPPPFNHPLSFNDFSFASILLLALQALKHTWGFSGNECERAILWPVGRPESWLNLTETFLIVSNDSIF